MADLTTVLYSISSVLFGLGIFIGWKYNVFIKRKDKRGKIKNKPVRKPAIKFKLTMQPEQPQTTFFTKDVMEYILMSFEESVSECCCCETNNDHKNCNWFTPQLDEESAPSMFNMSDQLDLNENCSLIEKSERLAITKTLSQVA